MHVFGHLFLVFFFSIIIFIRFRLLCVIFHYFLDAAEFNASYVCLCVCVRTGSMLFLSANHGSQPFNLYTICMICRHSLQFCRLSPMPVLPTVRPLPKHSASSIVASNPPPGLVALREGSIKSIFIIGPQFEQKTPR